MALLLILNSSCAVTIQNERWWGDLGPSGAVWFDTLDNQTGTVDKASWDALRIGMACTTTDTFAEIKKEIEQLCSASGRCDYPAVSQVLNKFQAKLSQINDTRK